MRHQPPTPDTVGLSTAGLVSVSGDQVEVDAGVGETAVDLLVADGRISAIDQECESHRVALETGRWSGEHEVKHGVRLVRSLRAAMLLGDEARLRKLLRYAPRYCSDLRGQDAFELAVRNWWWPDRLRRLQPRIRHLVIESLLRMTVMKLSPCPQLLAYLEEEEEDSLKGMDAGSGLATLLVILRLLQGRRDWLADWLKGPGKKSSLLAGVVHLSLGDRESAATHFAQGTEAELAKHGRKKRGKFVAPIWTSVLQLGLEAREAGKADLRRLSGCCRTLGKETDDMASVAYGLESLFERMAGRRPDTNVIPVNELALRGSGGVLVHVLSGVVACWCGDLPEPAARVLSQTARKARLAGLDLAADELTAALGQFEPRYEAAAAEIRERRAREGLHLWVDLLQPNPAWMTVLETIGTIAAAAQTKKSDAAASGRLVWLVQRETDDWRGTDLWRLSPRLQTAKKRGGWTKGRVVSIRGLLTGEDQSLAEMLSDHDRRVLATFVKPDYSLASNPAAEASEQSWLALVGHDRVFRDEAADIPVTVTALAPQLQVDREAAGYRLRLDPFPAEAQTVVLDWQSEHDLVVRHFDPPRRSLARLLGPDGLLVPATGRDLLREAMAAIAPTVPVGGDGAVAGGRDLSAEVCPRLLLTPYEDGLRGQIRVRPLGDDGPCLRPGTGSVHVTAVIAGEALRTRRDLAAESAAVKRLPEQCPTLNLVAGDGEDWVLPDIRDCLNLLLETQVAPELVVVEWPRGRPFTLRGPATSRQISLSLRRHADWFVVDGSLQVDDDLVLQMADLLDRLARGGGRFIALDDGQFLALTQHLASQLGHLAAVSEGEGDGRRLHHLVAPSLDEWLDECGRVEGDESWRQQREAVREIWNWQPELGPEFTGELRDYQYDGFQWLARMARWGVGACLADEMGLGKTVQTLAVVQSRAAFGPTLVVAPTSVCANWLREAARFTPSLRCHLYSEAPDRDALLVDLGSGDLVACSFTLLALDADRLEGVDWQGVILDEAQAIKNRETLRARASRRLRSHYRIATTGTPVENHLGELWSLFHFLNPGLLGAERQFRQRYQAATGEVDPASLEHLRAMVRPFILRRSKSAVLLDLPPRTDILAPVTPEPDEAAFYEALRQRAIGRLDDPAERGPMQVFAELMRLRRACCHPTLIDADCAVSGAKLEYALDLLDQIRENGHKCLVFSQFVDYLKIVEARLQRAGVRYQYLDGQTSPRQRQKAIDAFQAGDGDVFLISLKAGGTGLNLTRADYVLHLDPWWNPAVEDQASDRAHRIGQERPVTVYRLVLQGTIEERIVNLHHQKRQLADALLADGDSVAGLDADALLALLKEG